MFSFQKSRREGPSINLFLSLQDERDKKELLFKYLYIWLSFI